ncbi:MAG: hypothetical protein R3F11_20305 [Verrucomicrobiales bacterium]
MVDNLNNLQFPNTAGDPLFQSGDASAHAFTVPFRLSITGVHRDHRHRPEPARRPSVL